MSRVQLENPDIYRLEHYLSIFERITSMTNEEIAQRANPTGDEESHGEADQATLNYQRKILRKTQKYLLNEIDKIVSQKSSK